MTSRRKIPTWKRMMAACLAGAFIVQILAPPALARPTNAGNGMKGSAAVSHISPPGNAVAQAHSVAKAESKGQVETYTGGAWKALKAGPFTFDVNGAWRTGPSGVVTLTFEEGSNISLQGNSAMHIVESWNGLSNRFQVKAIGEVRGSLSPTFVAEKVILIEFPTAAVGINSQLTPSAPGGQPVQFVANTPNARELRVAVEKGAVATTGLPNVKGVVAKNPNTGELVRGTTIWVKEDMTGRYFEVNVTDPNAVIASNSQAAAKQPNEQKLKALQEGEAIIVYGPLPKDAGMASAFASDAIAAPVPILTMNALTLFPGNAVVINGSTFILTQPVSMTGFTSATVAGNTAVITAGQNIALSVSGLSPGVAGAGLSGIVTATSLLPALALLAAIGILVVVVTDQVNASN